jgi:hypothetical protein
MPSPNCIENIRKEPEPFNVPCTPAGCEKVMSGINAHCGPDKLREGTPVLSYDDNLNGPGKGGICYCCCSCLTYGTPVEKAPGVFVPAEQVRKGQSIMAAGPALKWASRQVAFDIGFLSRGQIDYVHTLRVEWPDQPPGFRELKITTDHLFLRTDGKLIAVQDIGAGEVLRRADGREARVIFRVLGQYSGGVHSIEMGPFENGDLNGHLLNTFGIVSADYAVQAAYAVGDRQLADLLVDDDQISVHGPDEVRASGDADALAEFLDDPSQWPEGFVPAGGRLVNVPKNARGFFTKAQADILRAELEFDSPGNVVASTMVEYLFVLAKAFYPDVTYILDWDNDAPNGYAFRKRDQTFVVVNGGLARIAVLNRNGMALVLANLIAHTTGAYCVGEADYHAVADVLRLMWNGEMLGTIYVESTRQLAEIFQHLPDNGIDTCDEPSTSCRLDAYKAGLMLAPVPECARGHRDPFGLREAVCNDELDSVTLFFTEFVEDISATRKSNYKLGKGVTVVSAVVTRADPAAVQLAVTGLRPDAEYTVTVSNVRSATDRPLGEGENTAVFRTPAARKGYRP